MAAVLANAEPPGLRVDLAGRTTRVDIRPDEGISALRSRVADAFGLTTAFDLVTAQGAPIRADQDGRTASIPEASIDAGEEILVDLERAHEETGAIRWVMLRQVLAGFRRQIAEANSGIAEAQHRDAVLDEQLVRERASRESGDAASAADLRKLAVRVEEDIQQSREQAQRSLEAVVTQMQSQLQAAIDALHGKCQEEINAVRQELSRETSSREAASLEFSSSLSSANATLQHEAEVRTREIEQALASLSSLQASVERETSARSALQAQLDTEIASMKRHLSEEGAQRTTDFSGLNSSIKEIREALEDEGTTRSKALEAADCHIKQTAETAEAKLNAHQAQLHERLDTLASLEGLMHELTDKERARREIGLAEMARSIQDFSHKMEAQLTDRNTLETSLRELIEAAGADAAKARSSLEEKILSNCSEMKSLEERLVAESQLRGKDIQAVQANVDAVAEDMKLGRKEFKEACKDLSQEEAKKREEGMEEIRRIHAAHGEEQRKWASMLIEQLTRDFKSEQEATLVEFRKRVEELVKDVSDRVRSDVVAQVYRVESSSAERLRAQDLALAEDRARRDMDWQHTNTEIRDCLTSHSDFMEALEKEQKVLISNLREGLSSQDQKSTDLDKRVRSFECDMLKVRGHLPILFIDAKAFG